MQRLRGFGYLAGAGRVIDRRGVAIRARHEKPEEPSVEMMSTTAESPPIAE